jgi:predicted nucleic acid-binding Zn ribbon protein
MTKNCPSCGKTLPDDAKFCMDCGYAFDKKVNNNIFSNGNIFIILIAIILVVGGIFIIASSFGDGGSSSVAADSDGHAVDLTITDVNGWDSDDDSKKSYTLYTEAIFNSVPDDLKGYNVKTRYYDSNDTEIGHETETLDDIYYDSNYALSFGHYTTYKLPDPDHVTVEIIKDGKVIDSYTEQIDKSKIDYLN